MRTITQVSENIHGYSFLINVYWLFKLFSFKLEPKVF